MGSHIITMQISHENAKLESVANVITSGTGFNCNAEALSVVEVLYL